jgi:S-adenosylmethionine synthetase
MELAIVRAEGRPPGEERVEIVERKGLGHPDSICDALAEELSLELSRFYLERAGAILHHNVDKALLVGGRARPRFGGGAVIEPIRIFLAGRAALACDGIAVPVAELAENAARRWLERNLHALDPDRHTVVSTLVRPGSTELVDLFDQQRGAPRALANDTSIGVGYAPLSELEQVVLAVEGELNSVTARASAPAFGEDVKVMALRRGEQVQLMIARAMVDAALRDLTDYAKATQRTAELAHEAAAQVTSLPVRVEVNAADDLGQGRVYLTVTGTSAEAGDDGQAGRGNRVNGLIAPGRPMTMESVAGKNPVSHVGKLYNLMAGSAADRIATSLPAVRAAECRMISRIGQPIDEPALVEVRVHGADPELDPDLAREIERILREELDHLPKLAAELLSGEIRLDRWPLRARTASAGAGPG